MRSRIVSHVPHRWMALQVLEGHVAFGEDNEEQLAPLSCVATKQSPGATQAHAARRGTWQPTRVQTPDRRSPVESRGRANEVTSSSCVRSRKVALRARMLLAP